MNLIKRLLCSHKYVHVRNIHGDEINMFFPIKRSEWKCEKCGKYTLDSRLYYK